MGGTDVLQAPTCHLGRPPPRPCNKPMCHTATTEGAHDAERSMGGGDTRRREVGSPPVGNKMDA